MVRRHELAAGRGPRPRGRTCDQDERPVDHGQAPRTRRSSRAIGPRPRLARFGPPRSASPALSAHRSRPAWSSPTGARSDSRTAVGRSTKTSCVREMVGVVIGDAALGTERRLTQQRPIDGSQRGLCLLAVALRDHLYVERSGSSIDAINYLTAGINLAEGRGLRMLEDSPPTACPVAPLLAVGEALGIGGENMLRLVSKAPARGHRGPRPPSPHPIVSHRGVVDRDHRTVGGVPRCSRSRRWRSPSRPSSSPRWPSCSCWVAVRTGADQPPGCGAARKLLTLPCIPLPLHRPALVPVGGIALLRASARPTAAPWGGS